jgi:plasmid stabilization system protein ParE
MTRKLVISSRAAVELQAAADWWADHRSGEQSKKWLAGFQGALDSLKTEAERFPLARDNDRVSFEIRQLNYGVGRRPTHRAIFTILPDTVAVLSVRHLSQDDIVGGIDLL